jgi:hypothetical protein
MLIHRARTTLGRAGELRRHEGHLLFEPFIPMLLWDPRCERPLEDRVLSTLSRSGPKTAREAADDLGVPLRSVQAVLRTLSETDVCAPARTGRKITYSVEDTTFSDPTTARFNKYMIRF